MYKVLHYNLIFFLRIIDGGFYILMNCITYLFIMNVLNFIFLYDEVS